MKLRAIHFCPGVSVTVGGKYAAITFWDREKYPDVECIEQKNGDCWIVTKDGRVREVSALVIAWKLREPEAVKGNPVVGTPAKAAAV